MRFPLRRSRSDAEFVEAWREENRPFEQHDYTGPARGPLWQFQRRKAPMIVTAVHGVRHTRSESMGKANDANTAGLALVLAHHHQVSVGVVRRSDDQLDVNSDPGHPFKQALVEQLQPAAGDVLLDLHGMSDRHQVDIALGMGADPSPAVEAAGLAIERALRGAGLSVDLGGEGTGLMGAGPGTMTTWAAANGLVGVQLEIRQGLRSFRGSTSDRLRLVRGLNAAIRDLLT